VLESLAIPLISHAGLLAHALHEEDMQSGTAAVSIRIQTYKEIVMYLKLIAASLALAFFAGCNTMEGAGKDIQKGGEAIQNSADKHKGSN
jgi:predicted small secreted protein